MVGAKPIAESDGGDHAHVSVIVAVYNGAETLRDCLDSLLQLDYPPTRFELVCVDNASNDDTPRILAAYQDRITIVHEAKRGPAAARNAGLRRASGKIIALTDADCVVDRSWLRHLVEPLRDPRVGTVGGTILSKRPCNSIEAFGEKIHDHPRALYGMPPYAITMNWAASVDVLDEVGPFNEELLRCSDVDWSYRVALAGYQFVYAPAAVIYHQNERTAWGLMNEGYVHGYHGVRITRLYAEFLRRARREPAKARTPATTTAPLPYHLPPQPWRDAMWGHLFRLGKLVGRLHGRLSNL